MSSAFYSFINSITNSITSKYQIKSQISSSGLWKIYQGERKTTGQKVSIFIFEKKNLDLSFKRERGSSKHDTEAVFEILKKEAGNLARLRHPSILEMVEPVSESRNSLVFVTEPLIGSLTGLIKKDNSYSSDSPLPVLDLDELEIQKGLLQVGKGLQFLNDAKVVHHNLTTDAIFVNSKGDWKIGGLGFSIFLNQDNSNGNSHRMDESEYLPEACQINLDYAAPESVIDNNNCQANDMFSLGCLAYAVHNKGASILKTFNSFHTYEKQIKALSSNPLNNIPVYLQEVIRSLLTRHPNQRMDPVSFQNSKYFDNLLVSTMRFLESFPEKTREEKAQFMKGLSRVLNQFPERVLKKKVLYCLLEELKDHQLLPFTIPNIFIIAQKMSQQEFCDTILPSLKPIFSVRDPPQNMIVLLEKLDELQQKTPREVFRDDVMPLVYAALENPAAIVQEKALRTIPSLAEALDYAAVKSSLFPRVQTVFVQTTILSVKVSTLICFHSMIKVLDKFTIQEKLVPLLKNIKTKEPAVMLTTLAVYDEVGKIADKEIIATEILPQLWRMSFGPLLNLEQFQKFMKTIHDLTNRVEEAHTKHLQEVKSLEEQTRNVSTKNTTQAIEQSANDDTTVTFENLVQGGNKGRVQNNMSNNLNNNLNSGSDMFDTFTSNSGNQTVPQQKAISVTPTWSTTSQSPSLTSASLQSQITAGTTNSWNSGNVNNNQLNSSPMNNNWNAIKPIAPMTTTTSISVNKPIVWNNQNTTHSVPSNTSWTQPIKPISSPSMSQQPLKPMGSPSMSQQPLRPISSPSISQQPLQPISSNLSSSVMTPISSTNTGYDALRSVPGRSTPQPSLIPLSANMGLLKPMTPSTNAPLQSNIPHVTKTNLHAFDPLG